MNESVDARSFPAGLPTGPWAIAPEALVDLPDPPSTPEELAAWTRLLPVEDGIPMDTLWHHVAMTLLIEVLSYLWRERDDFFIGGNMFVYYSPQHAKKQDFRGPDFFYVDGADGRREREVWIAWEEGGKLPDFIMELTSPSTAHVDRVFKKDLYQNVWHTREYVLYDPETERFQGWRLDAAGVYQSIPADERGWLWSEVLGLWIGIWEGPYLNIRVNRRWPRFYDKDGGLVLHAAEAEQQHAEAERQRADAEQQRAEAERQHAEAERQRANAEQQRAEAAEAESARLKALLAEKGINP